MLLFFSSFTVYSDKSQILSTFNTKTIIFKKTRDPFLFGHYHAHSLTMTTISTSDMGSTIQHLHAIQTPLVIIIIINIRA